MIKIVNLNQWYGKRQVLKDINLEIDRGEVFAFIGPTGTGKTTLLRLIDLLEPPTSGEIYFDGVDATHTRQRLKLVRRMAFVLQKPVVFNASVYDNIAYGLKWRGMSRGAIRTRVSSFLEQVRLSHLADRNARTLSGGEAQRVAIARAMVIEPEVLLLDEPTANLDPVSTLQIEELIASISRQYRTTIVMATHDFSQGRRLASRIGVMVNGEIMQAGKADEVFSSPAKVEVAQFIGMENIFAGVVASKEGEVVTIDAGGRLIQAISDYPVGEEVYAFIRPEDITLAPSKTTSSARNFFAGTITRMVVSGSLAHVDIDCGFPVAALVTARSAEELSLASGVPVYVSFKATSIHVVKRR